ncbi:hypothetical protein GF327_09515, partial [Candidatus Woesearchaeota archaeon]|nr:hypothetical protein [Candidatus Woesearchaeota archaeon]
NMEKADFLLDCANQAGFRRAGIITISRRIIIEIFSTERIDVPVSENKELLVSSDYLKFLVKEANKKLLISRKKIKKLFSLIKNP